MIAEYLNTRWDAGDIGDGEADPVPEELAATFALLALADALGDQFRRGFWLGLIAEARANPPAVLVPVFPLVAAYAGSLADLGPAAAVRRLAAALLDPAASWATLGLPGVDDEVMGGAPSLELKAALVAMIEGGAAAQLAAVAGEIGGLGQG